ncbi:aminopeptidase P family protein [Sodaliphilus pleomorphus]|uniref:Aminopeptidase P family protein n=1 Tax=Sodaliphilus pleomorphus TaxID=2606626 RepID=A0A6L5XCE9_9BACT|nr:aminopeptidase P family protein [Sodaliphilus pleomorphus]MSS16746.1 aminopeptidase P family protein [Sodaliphilus pleomorphus]
MSKDTYQHLEELRQYMRGKHVDAVIIPGTDPHQSEYTCDYWKYREYLTGFTGDNGTAVVTLDKAGLWTDSRYFLQAQEQLADSGFVMYKERVPGEPTVHEWLASELGEDALVAIDGRMFTLVEANRLENFCGQNGFMLATDFFPSDAIWTGRPEMPSGPASVYPVEYDGEDVDSKMDRVMRAVKAAGADGMLVTALDEIAWLFNLRGTDVAYTPVVMAYAFITNHDRVLFIDQNKVTKQVKDHLKQHDVKVKDYDEVEKFLSHVSERLTVALDPHRVSDRLGQALMCSKLYIASPIIDLKAVKNEVEIAGYREAMKADGAALVRAFMWIEANAAQGITELDVDNRLQQERARCELYRGDSFHTIAGYKEHGAIVHYEASEQSASTLAPDGLLLVDTGGQYLNGTTDITRTITLGNVTAQQRHDYTLVLKGHLALARAVFPYNTYGSQLDILAHGPLWQEGLNYGHGTGHGVGHFLGCHEGPFQIRMNYIPAPLRLGEVTSDEPGLYKTGEYGIRIENLLLVVPAMSNEDYGDFYKFEVLTLMPYDTRLIDKSMLSPEEVKQVNDYHARVLAELGPLLSPEEQQWLAAKTQAI